MITPRLNQLSEGVQMAEADHAPPEASRLLTASLSKVPVGAIR